MKLVSAPNDDIKSEIFTLHIFISAKDLPFGKIAYSTAVPHGSTFIIVGGEFYEGADSTYYDTVYR